MFPEDRSLKRVKVKGVGQECPTDTAIETTADVLSFSILYQPYNAPFPH